MPAKSPDDGAAALPPAVTGGHLLGGRVRYLQPAEGFRSGIEPVLLAAAVPARPGERILEGGSGAGAALLCLAARVAGVIGTGVERDPALAELAAANAAANGLPLQFIAAELETAALQGPFDHAMANPPYHAAGGPASPDAARETAKRGAPGLLTAWAERLGGSLRRHGSLTLILPAWRVAECLLAMQAAQCPPAAIQPLWPKAGREAKLVLVQGRRFGRAPLRLLPGLALHEADGSFTPRAEAVLRGGGKLDWG
ncbi:MAG TPA: methyltransferase [Acetobacteraceae bacterium]|nr:methyltransferase [Acetobacteraceae bacterium]